MHTQTILLLKYVIDLIVREPSFTPVRRFVMSRGFVLFLIVTISLWTRHRRNNVSQSSFVLKLIAWLPKRQIRFERRTKILLLMRSNTFRWRARFRDVKESVEDNKRSDINSNRRKSHTCGEPAEGRLRKLSKFQN